ncbi:response regulator [Aristophania vespae]|uniref:Response regulator n=1 Tax=Aristophania vespae TaxID=2697033 RepID=A0A6P1NBF2_9PROT|nr:response regulator [Aristophania vespae]QHI95995.1 response regulator [Aristophania vespae]UMM63754.1 hypothetical protein DM15PD_07300 [Aristophania vespae]
MIKAGHALLIEDEEMVAILIESVLKKEGYCVFKFSSAEDSLEQAEKLEPALLISDLNLAGALNGKVLAQKLRAKFPQLAVILTSGSFDESQTSVQGLEKVSLLPKPFRKTVLLEKIKEAYSFYAGNKT